MCVTDGKGYDLPPWAVERYRLWSIYDMLRHLPSLLAIHMRDLAAQAHLLSFRQVEGEGELPMNSDALRGNREDILKLLSEQLVDDEQALPLSRSLRWKIDRLRKRFEDEGDTLTETVANVLLKELPNDIVGELANSYFLMIRSDRRALYEQPSPPFGVEVAERFPDASYDISAAGRCMALDEWTAAVFHLMRVAEIGLTGLAAQLKLSVTGAEQWANLIDRIESEVRARERGPKAGVEADELVFYSGAAAQFWHFKDAWRNHVSHRRARYDEREAFGIYNHTANFMQDLARGLK